MTKKEAPHAPTRQMTTTRTPVTKTGLLFSMEEEELVEVVVEVGAQVVALVVVLVVAMVVAQVVALVVALVVVLVLEAVDVVEDEAEVVEDMLALLVVDTHSGMNLMLNLLMSLTSSPIVCLACTSPMASYLRAKQISFSSFSLRKSSPLWYYLQMSMPGCTLLSIPI